MSEVRWWPATQGDVFSLRIRELRTEQLGRRLDILIAGCGNGHPLELERVESRITGIDEELPILRAALESRGDLDARFLGDLRAAPLLPRTFDVVHVAFLLERVRHTELVLDRMVNALRPGGLLLIRMRDRTTAYGFCDRALPSWLRRLLWSAFAPQGAVGPLPAVYEQVASREGIHSYCLMRGLMIAEDYSGSSGPALRGPHSRLARAACHAVERLSGGRLPATRDEITLVIRKPQNHFARLI
ncbi:class I SAM-dependent methyltransferase [Sphaerisporangium sp. TRM90804]|uniref:class I SAM-dependent methyltransferase n=1 Tax=Sphaerisporangium sp. TRM90804 TaxID=3031113 RepID=UPI00244A3E31|nr:class I SAM-dependent methyltransferase [Sphaerisporangium sp. TRM90804]MDH2428761.1 class I SAM-dependent methyltransferase [Sphaerisporangium sp. TRM90804]